MGCLLRICLALFLAVGAAPWGAYIAARVPSLAAVQDAEWLGFGVFAVLGGLLGWLLGGVAWKTLKTVVVVAILIVAVALSWTGWQSWIDLGRAVVP